MHVSNSKKLALIAIGYVLSVVVGFVAAAVNEALMPDDVAQGSPGMVAFGDMILFIFVTGFFSLAPTWFLLKLLVATAPRTLLTAELFIATMGPVSWLAMTIMAVTTPPGGPSLQNVPQAAAQLFGLFLAFGAIPRMVLGPVLVVIEGVTLLLFRGGIARAGECRLQVRVSVTGSTDLSLGISVDRSTTTAYHPTELLDPTTGKVGSGARRAVLPAKAVSPFPRAAE
jgi:hypothetical protein